MIQESALSPWELAESDDGSLLDAVYAVAVITCPAVKVNNMDAEESSYQIKRQAGF